MRSSKRIERLAVVLDNETVASGLSAAARRHDGDVRFLIECDTGMGRNGVQTPEEAFGLAQLAMNLPRMHFEGLMTYPNSFPKTNEFFERALRLFERRRHSGAGRVRRRLAGAEDMWRNFRC